MSAPRVSVIVCAYNAEATIAECLDSLFAQTADDFETIVVDDGSTDGTVAVVERMSEGAPVRVRVVGMEHAGLAAARNRGMDESQAVYLTFVDADDTIEPTALERLVERAESIGADIVVCDMVYTDFETGSVMHVYHQGDGSLYRGSLIDSPGLLRKLGASACGKLMRRSLFEESAVRFPDGRTFEDLWTIYRICGEADRIAKVDEPLYNYRQSRQGSIMSTYDDRYFDIIEALAVTNDYFAERNTFAPLREDLLAINFYNLIYGRYTNLLEHGPRELCHRYLARAFAHMDGYFPGWRNERAVRMLCGRPTKAFVFTHRTLLQAFTDRKARG